MDKINAVGADIAEKVHIVVHLVEIGLCLVAIVVTYYAVMGLAVHAGHLFDKRRSAGGRVRR